MNRAYLQLGKAGDICNCLPILEKESRDTGQPANLVVSQSYLSLVEKLSYVNPTIWTGDWQETRAALAFAKKNFSQVICLSIFGKDFPIQRRTPSFALDQWERAGMVEDWDKLPLTFPRNGHKAKSFDILFADHSESAPFRFKDDLATLLHERFPHCSIQRLSELRLKQPTDFLYYYDAAKVLVSVDTMHLNLSRASKVPVVALIRNLPSRWHGLGYQRRFVLHCRYSDYEARKEEIVRAIALALIGKRELEVSLVPTAFPHGYNPSLIRWHDQELLVYRFHPKKDWCTQLALWDGKQTWPIMVPDAMQTCTAEDPRLFIHRERLHVSYVAARAMTGVFRSVIGYGELNFRGGQWRIEKFIQPFYGKNDWTGLEKNWCFFSHENRLFAIYDCGDEQSVLEFDGPMVINVHRSPVLTWPYGAIRGGAMLRDGEGWLRFFHSHNADMRDMSRVYRVGACRMRLDPPFRMLKISREPILAGNERWIPNCHHFKPNVIFPAGVAREGDGWKISVGLNDSEVGILRVTEKDLSL